MSVNSVPERSINCLVWLRVRSEKLTWPHTSQLVACLLLRVQLGGGRCWMGKRCNSESLWQTPSSWEGCLHMWLSLPLVNTPAASFLWPWLFSPVWSITPNVYSLMVGIPCSYIALWLGSFSVHFLNSPFTFDYTCKWILILSSCLDQGFSTSAHCCWHLGLDDCS